MEKPHKVHHKPSAGAKAAKKDAAKGVDRSGAKGFNPKVSVSAAQSSATVARSELCQLRQLRQLRTDGWSYV
jgi:ribosome biogenesis protein BMS1